MANKINPCPTETTCKTKNVSTFEPVKLKPHIMVKMPGVNYFSKFKNCEFRILKNLNVCNVVGQELTCPKVKA